MSSSTQPFVNDHADGHTSKADSSLDGNGGFQPTHKMTVQPPKKEDLQRSYATVVDEDANPQGWYGSMSTFPFPLRV